MRFGRSAQGKRLKIRKIMCKKTAKNNDGEQAKLHVLWRTTMENIGKAL